MPLYISPVEISSELPNVPLTGTFTVPVCTTLERFKKITSALFYGSLKGDEIDYDHLVDWLNAIPRIIPNCETIENDCTEWTALQDRVTFYPEIGATELPLGYVVNPWVEITGDNPLVGLKQGDIITDLLHIPPLPTIWDHLEDLGTVLALGYPSISITDLVGKGTVRVYLVNVLLGGRALIVRDNDLLSASFLDTNLDTVSLPPETYAEHLVEYKFEGSGTHRLDIVFVPNVSADIEFLGYGGGFRRVEICGFEENMGNNDNCCDDDVKISYATYRNTQIVYQQTLKYLDDGDTAASFDAPSTFDGAEIDHPEYALCRTLNRLLGSIFKDQALQLGNASAVFDAINKWFPTANPIAGVLGGVVNSLLASHLADLVNDCNAVRAVSCCMRDYLSGKSTSIINLKNALGGCGFDFGSHEAEISAMVNKALQDSNNARAFIAAMKEDIDAVGAEGGATADDCACECCADELILIDFASTGCTITPVGNCIYRFDMKQSGEHVYASFKDSLERCLHVEFAGDAYPYPSVSDCTTHGCCGSGDYNGVGGFAPVTIADVTWRTGYLGSNATQYYKITLQDMSECP